MGRTRVTGTVLAALIPLVASACGPAQIVITAEIEVEDPTTGTTVQRPLDDLEILVLPYDRDMIFDSLATAADRPEPEIPAELLAAQSEVAAAQQEWRDAETRWNTIRDSLQAINSQLEGLSRGEARYVALFREWQDLDRQYQGVERTMNSAFQRFEELQAATIAQIEEVRMVRDEWADEAFAAVNAVRDAKVRETGLDIVVDTTDANGIAVVDASPGQYWVHTRYERPYDELYWNVPITLARGEPLEIRLDDSNAEVRPIF